MRRGSLSRCGGDYGQRSASALQPKVNVLARLGGLGSGQLFLILVAHPLRSLVIEERNESIATAAAHRRHLVQQRARKYDRVTWRGAVGLIAEFRKAQMPAFIVRV